MGRLVSGVRRSSMPLVLSPVSVHALNAATPADEKPASKAGDDSFGERIAKYVPAEVMAFFLTTDALFPDPNTSMPAGCGSKLTLTCITATSAVWPAVIVFLVGLIATPIYIWQMRGTDPWRVHAVMATIAFVVWAYAIHAHIFIGGLYDTAWCAFFVALYSLASGFVVPTKAT